MMNKDEVIELMISSMNKDTLQMCEQAGMPKKDIDSNMSESQQSLYYLLSNVYDKLKESGQIV